MGKLTNKEFAGPEFNIYKYVKYEKLIYQP